MLLGNNTTTIMYKNFITTISNIAKNHLYIYIYIYIYIQTRIMSKFIPRQYGYLNIFILNILSGFYEK
jgi:hypothetical protein